MNLLARIRVEETHGIRRFLYPMSITMPWDISDRSMVHLVDTNGDLVPSEAFKSGKNTRIEFAVSLAPHEKRKLLIVYSADIPAIPDPIHCSMSPEGGITTTQERVAFHIAPSGQLASVVYDSIEHLAAPIAFRLNGSEPVETMLTDRIWPGQLAVAAVARGSFPGNVEFRTSLALTACKSWIQINHTVRKIAPDSTLEIEIPLTPAEAGEVPTCDFGLGNGAYSKNDGDAVVMEAELTKRLTSRWKIVRVFGDSVRVDYEGQVRSPSAFRFRAWFHWTLPGRSIAVAVTGLPRGCRGLQFRLGRNGLLRVTAVVGKHPSPKTRLGICCHFLNAIPPIAAATNPASILLPPVVKIIGEGR